MLHNFWLAKPYGLANQKLCYIKNYLSLGKRQQMLLRMVGEYVPGSSDILWQTINFEAMLKPARFNYFCLHFVSDLKF